MSEAKPCEPFERIWVLSTGHEAGGLHLRKWDTVPFEGATEYVLASQSPPDPEWMSQSELIDHAAAARSPPARIWDDETKTLVHPPKSPPPPDGVRAQELADRLLEAVSISYRQSGGAYIDPVTKPRFVEVLRTLSAQRPPPTAAKTEDERAVTRLATRTDLGLPPPIRGEELCPDCQRPTVEGAGRGFITQCGRRIASIQDALPGGCDEAKAALTTPSSPEGWVLDGVRECAKAIAEERRRYNEDSPTWRAFGFCIDICRHVGEQLAASPSSTPKEPK